MNFILNAGILANILLVYILWKNGRKELHVNILFFIFFWILCTQLCFFGFINKHKLIFYSTFLFLDTISISLGPALLLYTKAIFFPTSNMLKKNSIHFIIPLLYLVVDSIPKLISLINHPGDLEHLRVGLENLWALSVINSLVYCIITISTLRRLSKLTRVYSANVSPSDFHWLLKFLYSAICIIGIDISVTIYEVFVGDITSAVGIMALFVVVVVVYLAYFGISQTKVLLPEFLLNSKAYVKSTIRTPTLDAVKLMYPLDEMKSIKLQLEVLMLEKKRYLIPELSLKSVSEELAISDRKLSYILNQYMEVSFYDYINRYRIEEVKEKIKDSSFSKYTLLGIALECGFNSKTSFNRTFQRIEKMTPSKYRNNIAKLTTIKKRVDL